MLGEDIASKLNNIGHLTSLRRTRVGIASVNDAKTLDEVTEKDLIPIKELLKDIPHFVLCGEKLEQAKHGMTISIDTMENNDKILILDGDENTIAMYGHSHKNFYKCIRGLN